MKYRSLGNSGLKVSVIGLGTNQFGGKVDLPTTRNIIDTAIDAGVNFIDTADVYQKGRSEEFIGKALNGKREKILLATKVFYPTGDGPNDRGASRQHILEAVHASLRRLNTDYIDLYQIHRWDVDTTIDETMQVLDDLIKTGKVRYIGASNFSAWQLTWSNASAKLNSWSEFISIQPHFHMLERSIENELIPACEYFGIGILPYFPLAGGFLTGKYKQDQPAPEGSRGESSKYVQKYLSPDYFSIIQRLSQFATDKDHALNELAHSWLLAQPTVSCVISGATNPEHVIANTAAVDWELSIEEIDQVNQILERNE